MKGFYIYCLLLLFLLQTSCGQKFESNTNSASKFDFNLSIKNNNTEVSNKIEGDLTLKVSRINSDVKLEWSKLHQDAKHDIFINDKYFKTVSHFSYTITKFERLMSGNETFQIQAHHDGIYSDRSAVIPLMNNDSVLVVQPSSTVQNRSVASAPKESAPAVQNRSVANTSSDRISNLNGEVYNASELGIKWDQAASSLNVKGYEIYREGQYRSYVEFNKGPYFRDTGLVSGKEYAYKIRIQLRDGGRLLDFSDEIKLRTHSSVDTRSKDTATSVGVSTVSNLRADVISSNSIRLHWNGAIRSDVKGYEIYKNGSYKGYVDNGTNYIDQNLNQRQEHRYKVRIQLTNNELLDFTPEVEARLNADEAPPAPAPPAPEAAPSRGVASVLPIDGNWSIEFEDQFDGQAGQEPGAPWHYDLTYHGEDKVHRNEQLNGRRHALLNGDSKLKMSIVHENGQVKSSILRSANFERGDQLGKDFLVARSADSSYLLDPTRGPLYIETSVRLDKAYQTEDTWWAFWLFSPKTYDKNTGNYDVNYSRNTDQISRLDPYDSNADTGMEVDIFEYVPYLGNSEYESRNGFNMAVFTRDERTDNGVYQGPLARHMHQQRGVEEQGFVSDLNEFLAGKGRSERINLTDGSYHKIGMYWDNNKYEFYIDGIKIWEVTDQEFITKTRANALVLSWEYTNGLWGDSIDRNFKDTSRDVYVLVDYVKVWRKQ